MTPINRHMTEFWDSKKAFRDLDEPEEYCGKISVPYDSATPNDVRLKIVKINGAALPSR